MTDLDISVIICAYTEARWDDLLSAVASVQKQTCPPREIIVVVDYNPVLFSRVREHLAQIVVIENTEPQGLSGARNSGIAAAKGELVYRTRHRISRRRCGGGVGLAGATCS